MSTSGGPIRVRKAWRVSIGWDGPTDIVYAPSAGKARYKAMMSVDRDGLKITDIRAYRAPSADVQLPARDPIVDSLTSDELHCLLHSFGADQGNPERAGYRDYFYTRRDDPPLVRLAELGLMKPMDGDKFGEGMTYFVMTVRGKQVAQSMVPEYGR